MLEIPITIEDGLNATSESAVVDFKAEIDLGSTRDKCEIVKDMVAMANSGGGLILIGLDDFGEPVPNQTSLKIDPADLTNWINSYTHVQFSELKVTYHEKKGCEICTVSIGSAEYPLVFVRNGQYRGADGKDKSAFAQGTIYFRHGAKSEPGSYIDLREFIEARVSNIREEITANLQKVVNAPPGTMVSLHDPNTNHVDIGPVRLVGDSEARQAVHLRPDQTHPLRMTDVERIVKERLPKNSGFNRHDLIVMNVVHKIIDNPQFAYHSSILDAARYSHAYVDWLIEQYDNDKDFFKKSRDEYHIRDKEA